MYICVYWDVIRWLTADARALELQKAVCGEGLVADGVVVEHQSPMHAAVCVCSKQLIRAILIYTYEVYIISCIFQGIGEYVYMFCIMVLSSLNIYIENMQWIWCLALQAQMGGGRRGVTPNDGVFLLTNHQWRYRKFEMRLQTYNRVAVMFACCDKLFFCDKKLAEFFCRNVFLLFSYYIIMHNFLVVRLSKL